MNKILSYNNRLISMLLIVSFGFVCFNSCEKEEDFGSNPITVSSVHLNDADDTVIDREVVFARLNSLIRLQGSGFKGMRKVYINGMDSYFNPVYVTDNSMLVKIPKDAPTIDADEEVRNKIRLVKTGTEYTFDFDIRASAPTVSRISHTLPQAGETITLYGSNLTEISKITFPGGIEVTESIESDEDGEFCTLTVPSGITKSGAVLVEGSNGKAYSPSYFNFKAGIVNNFDDRNHHSWGSGISGNISEALPATGNGPKSQGNYRSLNPDGIIFGSGPKLAFSWAKSDVWKDLLPAYIPTITPATEMAFQFDMYVATEWNAGSVHVVLLDEFPTDALYEYDYAPWINRTSGAKRDIFTTDAWFTVSIPLNTFGAYSTEGTFQTLLDKEATTQFHQYGIFFNNTLIDGIEPIDTDVEIFYDNFRFVPIDTPPVSDYDDEE